MDAIAGKRYNPKLGISMHIMFSVKEEARFRAYLKRTDKKAGAFARTAIIAAIDKDGAA